MFYYLRASLDLLCHIWSDKFNHLAQLHKKTFIESKSRQINTTNLLIYHILYLTKLIFFLFLEIILQPYLNLSFVTYFSFSSTVYKFVLYFIVDCYSWTTWYTFSLCISYIQIGWYKMSKAFVQRRRVLTKASLT